MSAEAEGASDRIRGRGTPRWLPRGEAVLPFLALALFVLMFVAGPLADIGVLKRPLLGMVMLIVMLSGLFTLGVIGCGPGVRFGAYSAVQSRYQALGAHR
jgi:hypothetical protein